MTFIHTIPEKAANGETAAMYDRAKESFGFLPNLARVFSHRPEVMNAWMELISRIRGNMDLRRYELVTIAAAKELRSSYCLLAHSAILLQGHYDASELQTIVATPINSALSPADKAIMRFAAKVVRDAASIGSKDIDELKEHGLSDPEIFDIAAAAAARCFFSKTLDALGAQPDGKFGEMREELRNILVVGRPIDGTAQV